MCFCVFPDSSSLTLAGLQHFNQLYGLKFLSIKKLDINLINGKEKRVEAVNWFRGLQSVKEFFIIGELLWHKPAAEYRSRGNKL